MSGFMSNTGTHAFLHKDSAIFLKINDIIRKKSTFTIEIVMAFVL